MVESTLQAVLVLAKAPTIGVISVGVANLTEEVLKTMFLTKLKLIFAAVLTTSALAIGTAACWADREIDLIECRRRMIRKRKRLALEERQPGTARSRRRRSSSSLAA